MVEIGKKAPEFSLPDHKGEIIKLSDFKGKWIILYFYLKDNTPGCTKEALDFTKQSKNVEKLGGVIIGISPDSENSHQKFIDKHKLSIILLSDKQKETIKNYGTWRLKKIYGKEYEGLIRSTFIISPKGEIVKLWKNVKDEERVLYFVSLTVLSAKMCLEICCVCFPQQCKYNGLNSNVGP